MSTDMLQQVVKKREGDSLDTALSPQLRDNPAKVLQEPAPVEARRAPVTDVDRPSAALKSEPSLDTEAAFPRRPAALQADQASITARTDTVYLPSVLDKIVTFLAGLLKRLERFLIGKFEDRRKKNKYKLRRLQAEEPQADPGISEMPEETDQPLQGDRIKWKDRKIKDLEF